jgi:hypothetical protein
MGVLRDQLRFIRSPKTFIEQLLNNPRAYIAAYLAFYSVTIYHSQGLGKLKSVFVAAVA